MERTKAFTLKYSHKLSYFDCHHQFLPLDHPYKRNKNSFKKRCVEMSHPPPRLSSPDIWKRVAHLPFSYDLQEEEQEIPGYGVQHNWKKQSIFWRLPYWNTHLLRHNIDVMHTERNVFMNVFDIVMDINGRTKDWFLRLFLHSLKNKVKNKARVEASICEAYLVEETSTFASFYYPDKIETRRTLIPRNVDLGEGSSSTPPISIFNYPRRPGGKAITYFLGQDDLQATHLYILLNCEHVKSCLDIYTEFLRELNPTTSDGEVDHDISSKFPAWFKQYVLNSENNIQELLLVNLAWGLKRKVESCFMYIINGYKFHTIVWSEGMNSINHGVYVRGTNGQLESDFYGNLTDIIQLEYTGFPIMKLVLFKCDWFDNTSNIGTKYGHHKDINKAYDSFLFSQQPKQVYYTSYLEEHHCWLAVIKTKIEQKASYQDDDFVGLQVVFHIDPNVINESLADIDDGGEEVDRQLLNQTKFDEPNEDEYIITKSESESDFNDTNTSKERGQPTINSPTSINHISTSKSTILIHQQGILPTTEEEPQPIEVGNIVVTHSTLQDSFTPDYPSLHSEHAVNQRSFLQIYTTPWSFSCDLINY
ncbi:hypothetical protein CR513_41860, partial [Mucuna pruriens]